MRKGIFLILSIVLSIFYLTSPPQLQEKQPEEKFKKNRKVPRGRGSIVLKSRPLLFRKKQFHAEFPR